MEIIMTEMLWAAVLLVVGFVLLIKGADFFVEGSSSVAKMLKVPSIIIGLTIVAMGTSLPECAVSITASVTNNNALAVSNAIGSNIFNLMVVCGFCALFNPLYVEKSTLKKEFPFSVVCAVLLLVCGYLGMQLGRADGIILLIVFVAFLVWMVRSALKARAVAGVEMYCVYRRRYCGDQVRWGFCCKRRIHGCHEAGTQPESDRTYDCCLWNQPARTCDLSGCSAQK